MNPLIGCFFGIPFVILVVLKIYFCRAAWCKNKKNLSEKVIIITGASSGIGKYVATECARRKATVILACRNKFKAEGITTQIKRKTNNEDVSFIQLDLSSLKSVADFVETFFKQYSGLDVLVNNAAYVGARAKTTDGFDQSFQVNYLGHFYLTNLLLRRLKSSTNRLRIINMASTLYRKEGLDFDDIMNLRGQYDMYSAYKTSKLAMLLFTVELAYRYAAEKIVSMAVSPGIVKSNLLSNLPGRKGNMLRHLATIVFRNSEMGAQSVLHCITTDDVTDLCGKLIEDCKPIDMEQVARDYKTAERLWSISNDLCGLKDELSSKSAVQ